MFELASIDVRIGIGAVLDGFDLQSWVTTDGSDARTPINSICSGAARQT